MITEKIEEAIEQLRPFLIADGGNIEFVSVDEGVVKVKFIGACSSCSMNNMTLKAGVEDAVKKAVPEIKEVVAVE